MGLPGVGSLAARSIASGVLSCVPKSGAVTYHYSGSAESLIVTNNPVPDG